MTSTTSTQLYLDLLKRVLTRHITQDTRWIATPGPGTRAEQLLGELRRELGRDDVQLACDGEFEAGAREEGKDHPGAGETMIGLRRLDNLDACIRTALADDVPGDLMECGVWRGGASIFMRAALEAHGDTDRLVWVADSFRGVPHPDPVVFPEDRVAEWLGGQMAVSQEEVEENFRRYGLLDDRVRFVPGFFRDTMPSVEVEQLAVLRLDGDLYESIFLTLEALYDKLSPGGFVILDDYNSFPPARQAADDFRRDHGVDEPLEPVDWTEVFWRKRA